MIHELTVAGYRSIRNLRLQLRQVNVLVGPNGCGKSNLYRSMYLLSQAAQGRLARALAEEGGMPSVLWAGARKKGAVRMTLGVRLDDFEYEWQCGLPVPPNPFPLDPVVKEEHVRVPGPGARKVAMLERKSRTLFVRDGEGRRVTYPVALSDSESALSQIREPHLYPELSLLRLEMSRWRFYHHFRTDPDSPMRQPQVGVRTPVLSHDGSDLAAALQTLLTLGDREGLLRAFEDGIPGATLEIENRDGRFSVRVRMPGILRPFEGRELSDGTLRYLCLLAALLSPESPPLMALNEPETSLHHDLLEPLAELIARAGERSQLWITTHSRPLAERIAKHSGEKPVELEMAGGETKMAGRGLIDGEDDE